MDLKKWFSTRFDMRLASKLADFGYEIETKYKADGKGGRKYYCWDIKGIPPFGADQKFSRRSLEVAEAEKEAVKAIKDRDPDAPDTLSVVARDKLGATSRERKRDDLTLADYRDYWNSRITPEEGRQIAETIERARKGLKPKPANTVEKAMQYAIEHHYYRNSVYGYKPLLDHRHGKSHGRGACRRTSGQGSGTPGRAAGLDLGGRQGTARLCHDQGRARPGRPRPGFAQEGRGRCEPLGVGHAVDAEEMAKLSADQQAMVAAHPPVGRIR